MNLTENYAQQVINIVLNKLIIYLITEYLYIVRTYGNDSNLLIVFYVQIMPDDFVMQLHRF
ncbi:TPA: hypothetical protein HML88_24660 [Escherichia coli]|nr:hypothetical protein [Escherichia coli]